MTSLAPGNPAPDFTLPADDGNPVSLADFRGRKLVLFFYPKAATPGCTLEANDFNRLRPNFEAAGVAVIGVSADPVKKNAGFRKKQCLDFPLLSDETQDMLRAYGVWGEKSMYGKTYMGIERTTVLVAPDGTIAQVWPKVKVAGHAEEVLEAARAI